MSHLRYECSECGVGGVRLWREYQTFASDMRLWCRTYAERTQGDVLDMTLRPSIGMLVPAVPTGMDAAPWWGYLAIPPQAFGQWRDLPLAAP